MELEYIPKNRLAIHVFYHYLLPTALSIRVQIRIAIYMLIQDELRGDQHIHEAFIQRIKDRRVNIRLSSGDLSDIQTRALEEGVPYQTLIASVLHKYVTGRLAETRENAKPSTGAAAKRRATSGN